MLEKYDVTTSDGAFNGLREVPLAGLYRVFFSSLRHKKKNPPYNGGRSCFSITSSNSAVTHGRRVAILDGALVEFVPVVLVVFALVASLFQAEAHVGDHLRA